MPRISSKNQVTLPTSVLASAGFSSGDDVVIAADQRGKIVIQERARDIRALFTGLDLGFEPGDLSAVRAEERP